MKNLKPYLLRLILILFVPYLSSCEGSLTDEDILSADLMAIEAYAKANQLEGSLTEDDIFVQVDDSGIFSIQVDTLITFDTLFVDTFFVDTLLLDGTVVLDTVLQDTQLFKVEQLDSLFFLSPPSGSDTVLLSFELFTLEDQLIFSTDGHAFQINDSTYPILSQLLPGIEKGLDFFAKEGVGTLLLPSEEAYGRAGNGEQVPSNTPIRVDLQLLDFF